MFPCEITFLLGDQQSGSPWHFRNSSILYHTIGPNKPIWEIKILNFEIKTAWVISDSHWQSITKLRWLTPDNQHTLVWWLLWFRVWEVQFVLLAAAVQDYKTAVQHYLPIFIILLSKTNQVQWPYSYYAALQLLCGSGSGVEKLSLNMKGSRKVPISQLMSKSPWARLWTPGCSWWAGWCLVLFPPPSVYECMCEWVNVMPGQCKTAK